MGPRVVRSGGLVAPPVVFVECFHDPPSVPLFPEEAAVVSRAVDKRRREFATVRSCARAGLGELGLPAAPLVPGQRGAPRWPEGIVGSMSHCAGYRAAAVARADDVLAVGLDAEPNEPLGDDVLYAITLPQERDRLAELPSRSAGVCWDKLLFSAKESVYKTWYPLTGRWLDFGEAMISIDPATGAFHARLLVPGPMVAGARVTGFHGRWLAEDGLLRTAITLTRDRPGGWTAEPGEPPSLPAPRSL